VYPSLSEHSLPELISQGLYVTINSDDPPMFNTTLTKEYMAVSQTYGWRADFIQQLMLNAVRVTLLPEYEKKGMLRGFSAQFERLMQA
jgi:aminodeoxyfutalosine deaminase